jgi:hypothetical protein
MNKCDNCDFIEQEYARCENEGLTRDALTLKVAALQTDIIRLKKMTGRDNPTLCLCCGEIRESREVNCGNCLAPLVEEKVFGRLEPTEAQRLLGEVLAVLNGDGGHYALQNGEKAAAERGLQRFHDLKMQLDSMGVPK